MLRKYSPESAVMSISGNRRCMMDLWRPLSVSHSRRDHSSCRYYQMALSSSLPKSSLREMDSSDFLAEPSIARMKIHSSVRSESSWRRQDTWAMIGSSGSCMRALRMSYHRPISMSHETVVESRISGSIRESVSLSVPARLMSFSSYLKIYYSFTGHCFHTSSWPDCILRFMMRYRDYSE